MSTAPDKNPFAAPGAHVEDIDHGNAGMLAGRGARLGAALIDGLIQGAVYYAIATSLFPRVMYAEPEAVGSLVLQTVFGIVLFVLLNGLQLATQGQTIGKKLVGLRIVRSNGERASAGRLIGLRYVLQWVVFIIPVVGLVFALIDGLMIFRQSRKCLHDTIADTIVVNA